MKSALRRLVVQRARRRCEYCQLPMDLVPFAFEIDHVIARRHGGPTAAENLALACLACNNHKGPCIGCLEPRSRRFVRLFHPRRDQWRRHFRWHGARLVGKTPIGRATVLFLGINLPHRVRLRRRLINEGVFPP